MIWKFRAAPTINWVETPANGGSSFNPQKEATP
jgi:hypothetical protein